MGAAPRTPPPPPPLAPPRRVPPTAATGPRSRFWIRAVAAFVDFVALEIVNRAIATLLGGATVFTVGGTGILSLFEETGIGLLVEMCVVMAYFGLLEGGAAGQSLGKRAVGIRVVDQSSDNPIGYARAALRALARFLSAGFYMLGYLWMIWDENKQTWHDKIAGTVVVPARQPSPAIRS